METYDLSLAIRKAVPKGTVKRACQIITRQGKTPVSPGTDQGGTLKACAALAIATAAIEQEKGVTASKRFLKRVIAQKNKEEVLAVFERNNWGRALGEKIFFANDSFADSERTARVTLLFS